MLSWIIGVVPGVSGKVRTPCVWGASPSYIGPRTCRHLLTNYYKPVLDIEISIVGYATVKNIYKNKLLCKGKEMIFLWNCIGKTISWYAHGFLRKNVL